MKRITVLALFLACPLFADDWPQWRGPNRDGVSKETGLLSEWPKDGPKLLWSAREVNGGKSVGGGLSSLAVAKGRIFTLGQVKQGTAMFCVDEKTGKLLWSQVISDLEKDGDPRCTPTVDGEHVFGLSRKGNLACLKVEDGSIVWQKNLKTDFGGAMMSGWDYSESPTVDGSKLIVTPGGESSALVALDKLSGTLYWQSEIPKNGGAGYASIVSTTVNNTKVYLTLLGKSKGLVAVDAETGKFLWNYNKMANGTANIPTAVVDGDLVFTTTGYGSGSALLKIEPDAKGQLTARELYFLKGKDLQNHHGGVVRVGEYLYGGHGHNEGLPFCLEIKTGEFKWGPVRGPGDRSAAVVYADGHLYFRYESREMALIEATPKEYKVKSVFTPKLGGNGWPHPVVANGRLYLRGADDIQAFDIRK